KKTGRCILVWAEPGNRDNTPAYPVSGSWNSHPDIDLLPRYENCPSIVDVAGLLELQEKLHGTVTTAIMLGSGEIIELKAADITGVRKALRDEFKRIAKRDDRHDEVTEMESQLCEANPILKDCFQPNVPSFYMYNFEAVMASLGVRVKHIKSVRKPEAKDAKAEAKDEAEAVQAEAALVNTFKRNARKLPRTLRESTNERGEASETANAELVQLRISGFGTILGLCAGVYFQHILAGFILGLLLDTGYEMFKKLQLAGYGRTLAAGARNILSGMLAPAAKPYGAVVAAVLTVVLAPLLMGSTAQPGSALTLVG
ncbi:MAG: hypothetical protein NTY47_01335, partial [Candidatus Omnitrophica bacterium]|nr:hypothetical protein [Candidatus Omnitrophota bacterium]